MRAKFFHKLNSSRILTLIVGITNIWLFNIKLALVALICQGNFFYFATHFYSILLCPEGFLIFLHSTPSWYQYFCINPTFSMLLVTISVHWSHHRVHFTNCILNIPFPFFWNTPRHLFCISNSAKVRKVIITQTSQPNLF